MNEKTLTLTVATTDRRFSIKIPENECNRKFRELVQLLVPSPRIEVRPPEYIAGDSPDAALSNGIRAAYETRFEKATEALEDIDIPDADPDGAVSPTRPYWKQPEPVDHGWNNISVGHSQADSPQDGYKGFLYVECAHCGASFGFNAKTERSSFLCRNCEKETEFSNMVRAYANCKCGRQFKYRTNHTQELFDISCINCEAPISLVYNKKKDIYETLR